MVYVNSFERAKDYLDSRKGRWKHRAKIKHRTELTRVLYDEESAASQEYFSISLFDKEIIQYWADKIVLFDCGYFSYTTHNRFNEFLPNGWNVWGSTIRNVGLLGFVSTPQQVFPYNMPMEFTPDGWLAKVGGERVDELIYRDDVQRFHAGKIAYSISDYVTGYLRQFFKGALPRPALDDFCPECTRRRTLRPSHVAMHIQHKHYISRFMDAALSDANLGLVAQWCWHDGYVRGKEPKNQRELAEKTEYLIRYRNEPLQPLPIWKHPRDYWQDARKNLTSWLLRTLQFDTNLSWNRR